MSTQFLKYKFQLPTTYQWALLKIYFFRFVSSCYSHSWPWISGQPGMISPFLTYSFPLHSSHHPFVMLLFLCITILILFYQVKSHICIIPKVFYFLAFLLGVGIVYSFLSRLKRQENKENKSVDSADRSPGLNLSSPPLTSRKTMCSFLTSLCLSFCICKIGTIMVPVS